MATKRKSKNSNRKPRTSNPKKSRQGAAEDRKTVFDATARITDRDQLFTLENDNEIESYTTAIPDEDNHIPSETEKALNPAGASDLGDLDLPDPAHDMMRPASLRRAEIGERNVEDRQPLYAPQKNDGKEGEGNEYQTLTEEELHERATVLGIPGHQNMSHLQLVNALRKAVSL